MTRRVEQDAVTLYLIERLGNQLFQYAAGLAQARRLGVPLSLNLAYYRHKRPIRKNYAKTFELDAFDHGAIIPEDPQCHQHPLLALPAVPAARLWHNAIEPRLPRFTPPVFMEKSLDYDGRIDSVEAGTTLIGFFQSLRYIESVLPELRMRIPRLTDPSPWYLETTERLAADQGAILLNVRRSDYMLDQNRAIQGVVGRGYYANALRIARRLGYDGPVYVVSDSIDVAMAELDGLDDLIPLAPPPGTKPLEILLAVSKTDALVMANSTFSWWAGVLGSQENRLVVAPRPWMTAERDTHDLFPVDWMTLGRS